MGFGSFLSGMGTATDAMADKARQNEADTLASLRAKDAYRAESDRVRMNAGQTAVGLGPAIPGVPQVAGRMPSFAAVAPAPAAGASAPPAPTSEVAPHPDTVYSGFPPAAPAAPLPGKSAIYGNSPMGVGKSGAAPAAPAVPPTPTKASIYKSAPSGRGAPADKGAASLMDQMRAQDAARVADVASVDAGTPAPTAAPASTATYVDMAKKAAVDAGVDPDKFVRLIHSESSFRPDVPSSAGADKGLGIAQISAVHGLSDEQRKDPAVALPFAAKLLAGYLKSSGGDWTVALQKYKGASSAGGKAAMDPVIQKVIGGAPTAPSAAPTAQAPAEPMDTSMVALARAKQNADIMTAQGQHELRYLEMQFNSSSDPAYRDQIKTRYQQVQQGLYQGQMINLAHAAGTGNQNALLQLHQVYADTTGADSAIAPVANGRYVFAQPTEDGRYKAVSQPMEAKDMAYLMLQQVSPMVRAQNAATAATYADARAKAQGTAEGALPSKLAEEAAKGQQALSLEQIKQDGALASAIVTQGLKMDEVKVTPNPMGGYVVADRRGRVGEFVAAKSVNGITTKPTILWSSNVASSN